MKQRINLGENRTGWQYNYGDFCCVRKFDNGYKAYFFNTEWNGDHRRSYIVHVDSEEGPFKYRLEITINFKNDESHRFSYWGRTRKQIFSKMREEIKMTRRALEVLKLK